jgi:hypothetical protein
VVPLHTIKGNAIVLKISRAAMFAAVLSLTAIPSIGLVDAVAEDIAGAAAGVAGAGGSAGGASVAPTAPEAATEMQVPTFDSKVSIPTVTAVDSSMDEAAIRDALGPNFLNHVDDLAKLNATSITIPEITLTFSSTVGMITSKGTATYKDLVLSNIKNGLVGTLTIGSASSANDEGTFTYNKTTQSNVDIGAAMALLGLVKGDPASPMKPITTGYTGEGGSFSGSGIECTIGKWQGGMASGRPVKVAFSDLMDAFKTLNAASKEASPPAAALGTVVSYVTDILKAFNTSPGTFDGVSCSGNADGKPVSVSLGEIDVGGYQSAVYPAITLNAIKVDAGDEGTFSLDKAVFKTLDLNPPLDAIDGAGTLDEAWFDANARRLIPSWAGFSLAGLSLDMVDPEAPGSRIKANVTDFDLTLSDYLNGIPTKISTSAHGVDVPLPADSTDDSVVMLKSMGITSVNLNYDFSAAWDKATSQINIDKMSVSGNDLGSFAVAAVIGNATEQLFDPDTNVEMAAGMAVTIKSIKTDTVDAGLADKMVPLLAQQNGADPATFRSQMAAAAEGAAIAMLGSTDEARSLGEAVSDFIAGKKKALTITVTAKDPNGIAVPQLIQAEDDPTALAAAVNITGNAQ